MSGSDDASELLSGVDLTSLSIDRDAALRLALPSWMSPVVWSPASALLAAGDNGRQRVAVLAFDPPRSNLTQLAAFPILARNIESWASGWTTVSADDSLSVNAVPQAAGAAIVRAPGATRRVALEGLPAGLTGLVPGPYSVTATGADVRHDRQLTADLSAPATGSAAGSIDLSSWAAAAAPTAPRSLTPYLIVLALLAMAADWLVWRRLRR